jgi:hypothetical protein
MHINEIIAVVLSAAVVIASLVYASETARRHRRHTRTLKGRLAEMEKRVSEEEGDHSETRDKTQGVIESAQRLIAEMQKVREECDAHRDRADRQFKYIAKTCQERDAWVAIFRESSLAAGNAQDVLYREIDRCFRYVLAMSKKHGFPALEPKGDVVRSLVGFRTKYLDDSSIELAIAETTRCYLDEPAEAPQEPLRVTLPDIPGPPSGNVA